MSFAFPKPVPDSRTNFSDSDFDINYHEWIQIIQQRPPDYEELIISLSLYAFNRLSPSDQQEQLEELRRRHDVYVNVEDSDFIELFKKLTYSDQHNLLSNFLQKFKRGRLISSFKQLDAEHQQQLIESMNHLAPEENLRNHPSCLFKMFAKLLLNKLKKTKADFRLRRFTQLCRDRTRDVLKLTWKSKDEPEEDSSDWKSFFLGFSIIWFQGQLASRQDILIKQLSKGVGGAVVIEPRLQGDETEEDFKLRTFTELCNKIVDFRVQVKFLNNAEKILKMWGDYHFSDRSILEYDRAAELLSDLSTLGCSLMSAKYQRHKIEEMSELVEGGVTIIQESTDEEDFRMKRFKELFNQVPVRTRMDLFKELREILLKEKSYSEAVRFFRGLGSEDQTDMIEKLSDEITQYRHRKPALLIIEKFSGESEEDFRLRRFKEVCIKHLSTWEYIHWPSSEADIERVRQGMSDIYQESPYASFLFDASVTWFKAICANYRRNPSYIHDILFGQVEFRDHVIEKLPEESEEDFRLRRFTESFKRLHFTSQECILDYIQRTIFSDLGHPEPKEVPCGLSETPEGKGSFDPEWIKMKLPDPQDQGAAAAAAAATQGATSQAGGGRGQGTSRSTFRWRSFLLW